jgi:hypothetical protein
MEITSENKELTRDEEIEELAGLFFTKKQIMTIMDGDDDPILRGRLKSEAELRNSVFALAKNGSGPAQSMANDYIIKMKMEEADEETYY